MSEAPYAPPVSSVGRDVAERRRLPRYLYCCLLFAATAFFVPVLGVWAWLERRDQQQRQAAEAALEEGLLRASQASRPNVRTGLAFYNTDEGYDYTSAIDPAGHDALVALSGGPLQRVEVQFLVSPEAGHRAYLVGSVLRIPASLSSVSGNRAKCELVFTSNGEGTWVLSSVARR